MQKPKIIVRIGAEGGSITLFGYEVSHGDWRFCRAVNDQTPTILPESDGGGSAIKHSSQWVNTWDEGLALLDRYPWARLRGLEVHPDFRKRVWAAVTERLENRAGSRTLYSREEWATICGITNIPDK